MYWYINALKSWWVLDFYSILSIFKRNDLHWHRYPWKGWLQGIVVKLSWIHFLSWWWWLRSLVDFPTHYVSGGPGNIRNNVILVVIIMPVDMPMLLGPSCILFTNAASYIHQERALYLVRNLLDLQWTLFVLRHATGCHSMLCTWIYPCMVVQVSHKIESWFISLLLFVYRQSE